MRIDEVLDREILTEMTFPRAEVMRRVDSRQEIIALHAIKILCIPTGAISHWRRELIAWGNYLAGLKIARTEAPMGEQLAYLILYKRPFEPDHLTSTVAFIEMAAAEYDIDLNPDVNIVHERLHAFLTSLSERIGTGQKVNDVVLGLQPL